MEAGVVQFQPAKAVAQMFEIGGIDRKQRTEHHRHRWLKSGQRFSRLTLFVGQRVADLCIGNILDAGGDEPHLARAKPVDDNALGREHADAVDIARRARLHEAHFLPGFDFAVDDADQDHDAQIGIVPAIDQQRFQRRR